MAKRLGEIKRSSAASKKKWRAAHARSTGQARRQVNVGVNVQRSMGGPRGTMFWAWACPLGHGGKGQRNSARIYRDRNFKRCGGAYGKTPTGAVKSALHNFARKLR